MAIFPMPFGMGTLANLANPFARTRAPLGSGLFQSDEDYQNMAGDPSSPFQLGSGLYGQPSAAQVAPQSTQSAPQPQAQGMPEGGGMDKLSSLFSNPAFIFGMNLLGSSTSPNPWGPAMQNTLAGMAQAARAKREQSQTQIEQQRLGLEQQNAQRQGDQFNRELALKSRQTDISEPLTQAQITNMNAEGALHSAQVDMMQRKQAMIQQLLGMQGQGQQGAPAGQGMAPQSAPQATMPFGSGMAGIPLGNQSQAPQQGASQPSGQGMTPGQAQQSGIYEGLSPQQIKAVQTDLVFNEGKGVPEILSSAGKAIPGANGIMYHQNSGQLQVDPASMAAYTQMRSIDEQLKAGMDTVKVPMSDGTELMMPRDQAVKTLRSGSIPGNNYGNLRPSGASTGFQSFATPEEGVSALDQNLQAYASKGINTLRGVISRWSPPNENKTDDLVAAAAKRLGLNPDQKIDLTNPAVRQAVGSAIMLQEHGSNLFAPQLGRTQNPSQSLEGQKVQLQAQGMQNETAKTNQQLKDEQSKVAEGHANATQEFRAVSNSLTRLAGNASSLLQHPGLESNTGFGGVVPKIPGSPGKDAQVQLESLKSKLVVGVLSDLKTASKNGSSGFGQLSEKEGERLETFRDNLDRAQSYPQMQAALKDIIDFANTAKSGFEERYNSLYSKGSPNVAPSIGPTAPLAPLGQPTSPTGLTGQAAGASPQNPIPLRDLLAQKRAGAQGLGTQRVTGTITSR